MWDLNLLSGGRQTFYLNEYQNPLGKRTFQAKVTKSFSDGYTIETIIDGKPLRGVLFSNKPSPIIMGADDSIRKTKTLKNDGSNDDSAHTSAVESDKSVKDHFDDVKQADACQKEAEATGAHVEITASEMKNPTAAKSSMPQEVPGEPEPIPIALDADMEINGTNNLLSSSSEIQKENVSVDVVGDQITPSN